VSGRPSVQETLAALVGAGSCNPPGDERTVAAVVEQHAARLGLPRPRRLAARPERPNLLIEVGAGSPRLLVGAHMDTVPADPAAWTTDPWTLTERDGALQGLGAVDMKGALAALLHALAAYAERPAAHGTVVAALTADEEAGSAEGMGWLCAEGHVRADAAVMVEASSQGVRSWDRLYVAERGLCIVRVTVRGRPGHSSERVAVAERAPRRLVRCLSALWDAELGADARHPVDGMPPLFNVAPVIRAGTIPTVYEETCHALVEVRTVPGMSAEEVLAELERALASTGLPRCWELELETWSPPTDPVRDTRLLNAARAAWEQVLGTTPASGVFPAGTDAVHLAQIGIPTLSAFGPGSLASVHQADEALREDELLTSITLFEALIRRYHDGGAHRCPPGPAQRW